MGMLVAARASLILEHWPGSEDENDRGTELANGPSSEPAILPMREQGLSVAAATANSDLAMKRRILFVHDFPSALKGFHQAVLSMEPVWDMECVDSARHAMQALGPSRFEAVVVDVQPGIPAGIELLNKIRNRHAGVIRFALVDPQDKASLMVCAREMHQCLPRPCQPRTLIAGIRRALSLEGWLQDEKLRGLVAQMPPLPSLPSVYQQVVKELNSAEGSAEAVAETLSKDLGITARLLQTVNSAFYGQSRRITHVGEAVLILGTEAVRSIVLCSQACSQFDRDKPLPFSIDRLWTHSMAVGERARRIALLQTHQPEMADEAFTAGLMHDIGILVLAANLPDAYQELWQSLPQRSTPLWQLEKEVLGASHAEIGAYLLARWGMPITLIEAVAYHHEPARGIQDGFTVLTAVHGADAIVSEETAGCETSVLPALDEPYLESLGLRERVEIWRKCGDLHPTRTQTARSQARPVFSPATHFPAASAWKPTTAPRSQGWALASVAAGALGLVGLLIWLGSQ